MRYREIQPAPLLSAYVECFWLLESETSVPASAPERLLPDGCVELILNLGARFREYDASGQGVLQPARFVVGQMTRPVLVAPTGAVQILGIRFMPGGSLPFLNLPPAELTDCIAPLDAVAQELEKELRPLLDRETFDRLKLAQVENVLLRRLQAANARRGGLQPILRYLVREGGSLPVEQLSELTGISHRQLQRRFLHEVGLGPKLLSRILRFQQVFRAVESARADWAAVAVECGYYDQAHLIRDFRQFAGQTPALLFEDLSHLTELFTRKERVSHFSNTLDENTR